MMVDELLGELLVIKDLYICGRINTAISKCVILPDTADAKKKHREYADLSEAYIKDSIIELRHRYKAMRGLDPAQLDTVLNSSYQDFDDELFNPIMADYYTSKDSIAFAACYGLMGDDFNSILMEVF